MKSEINNEFAENGISGSSATKLPPFDGIYTTENGEGNKSNVCNQLRMVLFNRMILRVPHLTPPSLVNSEINLCQ
jgi:hypothetical protein